MERQEIMENNFSFKDNTFLIDGEILHQCILNNNEYMSVDNEKIREMILRFDSLLAKSKGRFYNIDNLKKIKNNMRDGIEDSSLINNIWADRALKIVSSTDGDWESLDSSALTLIEDNNEKWHALFHNDFEGNDSAIEIAKKRNNHIISFKEILNHKLNFSQYLSKLNGKNKQKDIQSMYFFSPLEHSSKFNVIYDPFLFKSGNNIMGLKPKGSNNFVEDKETYKTTALYNTRNHLSIYFDWIYKCFKKSNLKELPNVFLGGRSGTDYADTNNTRLKEVENLFKNQIIKSDNKNSSFKVMKKFFMEDKVKFFWINNRKYDKNKCLHENWIMNDYGCISWGYRKGAFESKNYKQNLFKHDLSLDVTQLSFNIFNTSETENLSKDRIYFKARNIFENIINEKN